MVNRIVPGKDFAPTKTLKDLNLLAIKEGNIMLRFSKKDRIQIMESLKKDLQLLSIYNMMDYSLLLCVENNPEYARISGR